MPTTAIKPEKKTSAAERPRPSTAHQSSHRRSALKNHVPAALMPLGESSSPEIYLGFIAMFPKFVSINIKQVSKGAKKAGADAPYYFEIKYENPTGIINEMTIKSHEVESRGQALEELRTLLSTLEERVYGAKHVARGKKSEFTLYYTPGVVSSILGVLGKEDKVYLKQIIPSFL